MNRMFSLVVAGLVVAAVSVFACAENVPASGVTIGEFARLA